MSIGACPSNWRTLDNESAEILSKEFYRQADRSHPLFNDRMWAIAQDLGSDNVLFEMHDGRFAEIHLTWSLETSPDFPAFALFDSCDEWAKNVEARNGSLEQDA